jgi:hypothetical protein
MAQKHARAGVSGGSGGEDIIDKDNSAALDSGSIRLQLERAAHIVSTRFSGEAGLRARICGARQNAPFDGNPSRLTEMASEALRLIELAFGFAARVERNGNDQVPGLCLNHRHGSLREQLRKERLHPKRVVVFVLMEDLEDHATCRHGGSGIRKAQVHLLAVAALEWAGDGAFENRAALFAERRLNEADAVAAFCTNISVCSSGPLDRARTATFVVEQAERRIDPGSPEFLSAVE